MKVDPVLAVVSRAIGLGHHGDRSGARDLLCRTWNDVGPEGDPLHLVGIAHAMADLQETPEDELVWDLRALAAADDLTDDRVAHAGTATSAAGFYPSLHLNLAEAYRRLGQPADALHHVRLGEAAAKGLNWAEASEDGYEGMILDAFARLRRRLNEEHLQE